MVRSKRSTVHNHDREQENQSELSEQNTQQRTQSTSQYANLAAAKFPFTMNPSTERQLTMLQSDIKNLINIKMTDVRMAIQSAAIDLENYAKEGNENLSKNLDQAFRSTIDLENILTIRLRSLIQLQSKSNGTLNIKLEYENFCKQFELEYESLTTRQKYNIKSYLDFASDIYSINHRNEAPPPITELFPREPGDPESDDEITMARTISITELKCPITLTWLVNPMSSTICPHSYSNEAILQYLQQSRINAACPVSGCKAKLTLNLLKPNPSLARRVSELIRDMDNDDSDDEGISVN